MATLAFKVEADYEEVMRLRQEIARLQTALGDLSKTGTPDEIARLENRLTECTGRMRQLVTAAADYGAHLERDVVTSVESAAKGFGSFTAGARGAASQLEALRTGDTKEKIDALSLAIQNNETVLAQSVATVNRWKEDARDAFERGDADGLKAITEDINEEISKIRQLSAETADYRSALQEVLSLTGQGGDTAKAPMLFASEDDLRRVDELRERISGLREEIASVGAEGGDTSALTEELTKTSDELGQCELKAAQAAAALGTDLGGRAAEAQEKLHELNEAITEQESAIEGLRGSVEEAREAYEALQNSGGATSDELEAAAATYNTLSESLLEAEERLASLKAEQREAAEGWSDISKEISEHDSVLTKMLGGYDNYKAVLGQLPGPLRSAISGVQGLTRAGLAFIATPLGAVIGAIVLALMALKKWFTSSAEGQRAFAKITGYVNGILGQFGEIVLKVGKAIYTAFTEPKKAITSLWEAMKTNLLNRMQAVGGIFTALGDVIKNAFNFQWDDAKASLKDLGDQFLQLTTGVENFADKAANAIGKVHDKATESADIATERQQLDMDESQFKIRREEIGMKMAEQGAIYRNTSLSQSERRKALDEYKKYNDELTQEELKYAKKNLELVQRENALTTNPLEAEKAENEAKARVAAVEREGAQRLATLARTESSIAKMGESAMRGQQQQLKQQQQLGQELLALRQKNQQAETDLMEEGTEKKLEKIRADYEAQEAEIAKQEAKWRESNKTAGVAGVGANGLTEEQQAATDRARELNSAKRDRQEADVWRQEKEALDDYLKSYGTYEQQKLAITEEYERKIREAQTMGERMQLTAQRDKDLKEVDMKFLDNTDWGAIFAKIDNYSTGYLNDLKGRLAEMLSDKDLTAEQAKVLGDKLAEINKQLIDRSRTWKDYVGLVNERTREQQKLQEDLVNLQDQLNRAKADQLEVDNQIADVKRQICDYVEEKIGVRLDVDDIDMQAADDILRQLADAGSTQEEQNGLSDMFTDLSSLQNRSNELGNTITGLNGSIDSTTDQIEGMGESAGGAAASFAMVEKIVKLVNANVQSMNSLLDEMGLGDSKFADGWKDFAESSQYATQGIEDLKSGNIVGVAADVMGSLRSLGNAIGKWTGSRLFGERDTTLEEDIEKMTSANKDLETAIKALTTVISENTTSLSEASEAYENALADLENAQANTQEMMSRSGADYSNGFLGVGGKKSSNYQINKGMTASDWKAVSEAAGVSVTSAEDFWNLTSEQMWNVSTYAASYYAKIKNLADDGYKDAAQYMDEYIGYYQELLDLQDEYAGKVTATTFDAVVSQFQSAISDMTHSAADFADDFEDMMKEAVISSMMSGTYTERLKSWYEDFQNAMESDSTLTSAEQSKLKDSYMDIVSDAKAEMESLYATMGWSREGYSQSASTGAFASMSEDTGEELNGRFTALQEAGYGILDKVGGMEGNIADMMGLIAEQVAAVEGVADIARDSRDILASSYLELQAINENTVLSAQRLAETNRYLKLVKENTDKL